MLTRILAAALVTILAVVGIGLKHFRLSEPVHHARPVLDRFMDRLSFRPVGEAGVTANGTFVSYSYAAPTCSLPLRLLVLGSGSEGARLLEAVVAPERYTVGFVLEGRRYAEFPALRRSAVQVLRSSLSALFLSGSTAGAQLYHTPLAVALPRSCPEFDLIPWEDLRDTTL
jgi:hypothetical protein